LIIPSHFCNFKTFQHFAKSVKIISRDALSKRNIFRTHVLISLFDRQIKHSKQLKLTALRYFFPRRESNPDLLFLWRMRWPLRHSVLPCGGVV
jgi:hypothetical protein